MKTLIVGFMRSGRAAAALMHREGHEIYVYDRDRIRGDLPAFVLENRSGLPYEEALKDIEFAVLSPSVSVNSEIVLECKKRGIETAGEIEAAFNVFKGFITAITGTNGKTTTATLTEAIYVNAGLKAAALGNIGAPFSLFIKNDVSDVVLEVSSFQLESIKRFKPDISVFLNFAPDHLDRHRSMEEYFEAKLRIFENQTQEDYAVINADDKRLEEYFLNAGYIYHGGGIMTNDKNGKKAKVNADVYFFSTIRRVKGVYADGEKIMFFDGNKTVKICGLNEIKLCGRHNLENVLAAMCAAKLRGIDNDAIIKALDGFVPPHNRIELVREVFGMRFFNDSKGTNIHATLAAIESMDGDTVLILGGSDKGEDFCELFSALPEKIKEICVTGQNAKKITEAAREFLKIKIAEFDTLYDCVKKATKTGCKNVLFSPASASFDRYKNYEERGRDFVKIVGGLADDNS